MIVRAVHPCLRTSSRAEVQYLRHRSATQPFKVLCRMDNVLELTKRGIYGLRGRTRRTADLVKVLLMDNAQQAVDKESSSETAQNCLDSLETEDLLALCLEDDFHGNVQSLPKRPLRPSEIPKRCSKCAGLSPDNLISRGPPVPHHRSFLDLEAATLAGCELCSLFLWKVPTTSYKYCPEKRRLLYATLRAADEPLFIA